MEYLIGKEVVGLKIVSLIFSPSKFWSPANINKKKRFENFSRQKFQSEAKNLVTFCRLIFYRQGIGIFTGVHLSPVAGK